MLSLYPKFSFIENRLTGNSVINTEFTSCTRRTDYSSRFRVEAFGADDQIVSVDGWTGVTSRTFNASSSTTLTANENNKS